MTMGNTYRIAHSMNLGDIPFDAGHSAELVDIVEDGSHVRYRFILSFNNWKICTRHLIVWHNDLADTIIT